ncbi:hypothetical protein P9112_006737 [Eukaryota sp. TZLM1-RC]
MTQSVLLLCICFFAVTLASQQQPQQPTITRQTTETLPKFIESVPFGFIVVGSDEKSEQFQKFIQLIKEVSQGLPTTYFTVFTDLNRSTLQLLNLPAPPPPDQPALFFVRHGIVRNYHGPRDTRGMIGYLSQLKNSNPIELSSKQGRKRFQNQHSPRVVGYFQSSTSPEAKAFVDASHFYTNLPFYIVTDKILARGLKLKQTPSIQLWKEDETPIDYSGKLKTADIVDWTDDNRRLLVENLHPESFGHIVSSGLPVVFFFHELNENSIFPIAKEVARQGETILIETDQGVKPQKVSYWSVDSTTFGEFITKFGVTKLPSVGVLDLSNQQQIIYPEDHELNVEEISLFIKQFLEGKIKQKVKSEDVPEVNEGPVYKVVTNNFFDLVYNEPRTVVLKCYTDWCGHCKNLAPIWTELAEDLVEMGRSDIVVAEIDMDKNVVPNHDVQSLPTLLKYKEGTKDAPEVYQGARDKGSLMQWILQ